MDKEQAPVFGYAGRCRQCGAILAWRPDQRDDLADVARKVEIMIRADLVVAYVRRDAFILAREMCTCVR